MYSPALRRTAPRIRHTLASDLCSPGCSLIPCPWVVNPPFGAWRSCEASDPTSKSRLHFRLLRLRHLHARHFDGFAVVRGHNPRCTRVIQIRPAPLPASRPLRCHLRHLRLPRDRLHQRQDRASQSPPRPESPPLRVAGWPDSRSCPPARAQYSPAAGASRFGFCSCASAPAEGLARYAFACTTSKLLAASNPAVAAAKTGASAGASRAAVESTVATALSSDGVQFTMFCATPVARAALHPRQRDQQSDQHPRSQLGG